VHGRAQIDFSSQIGIYARDMQPGFMASENAHTLSTPMAAIIEAQELSSELIMRNHSVQIQESIPEPFCEPVPMSPVQGIGSLCHSRASAGRSNDHRQSFGPLKRIFSKIWQGRDPYTHLRHAHIIQAMREKDLGGFDFLQPPSRIR